MNGYQNASADGHYSDSPQHYTRPYGANYGQDDGRQYSRPTPTSYTQQDYGYQPSQQYFAQGPQDDYGAYDQYAYQEPHQETRQPQRQFSYDQPQNNPPRTYHYDERYHNHNDRSMPPTNRSAQTHGRTSPNGSRPGTSASNKSRMKRERILEDNPAPKAMAWDNPFGVFPGTKKDIEAKKKQEEKARSKSATPTQPSPSDLPRPSPTSAPQASRPNMRPPQTSQERNPQSPQYQGGPHDNYVSPSDGSVHSQRYASTPFQNGPLDQVQDLKQSLPPQSVGLPQRPTASRSGTGSTYDRTPISPTNSQPPRNRDQTDQREPRRAPQSQFANRGNVEQPYNNESPEARGIYEMDGEPLKPPQKSFEQRRPSDPTWNRQGLGPARPALNNANSYRGAPQANTHSPPNEDAPMPNFAAMAPGKTEHVEKEITMQTGPVYKKQTYQEPSAIPTATAATRPKTASAGQEAAKSPLGDFSFDLPQSTNSPAPMSPQNVGQFSQHRNPISPSNGYQPRPPDNRAQHGMSETYQQVPPRRASERDESMVQSPREQTPSFKHSYNQPSQRGQPTTGAPPQRADTANTMRHAVPPQKMPSYNDDYRRNPQPDRDVYAHDQNSGYVDSHYQGAHGSSNHDPYYNQDVQGGYNDDYNQYESNEYRPNYGGHPERQEYHGPGYGQHPTQNPNYRQPLQQARAPTGAYPPSQGAGPNPLPRGMTVSDAAHPMPVRPGLMQPPPATTPTPKPVEQEAVPTPQEDLPLATRKGVRKTDQKEPPVTIAELNSLREMFKNNPNNHGLGLKFAKRLVEAAKVLANEGGRADPKKTAQNRERYVLDAHRVVKKLVSAGSADAMFYLADCYGQGLLGLEADPKEAFSLYNSAAKLGHAQSAYRVAVCCELGQQGGGGTRRDHLKAVQYYKRAATMGDTPAMYKMGMIQLKGLLGQIPNPREGITWLKRAADHADEDNPHALFELGLLYESARPTDTIVKDEAYARQLYYQGAELGYKYSQHRLGTAFEYGLLGCPIDPRQSIAWYTMAAKQAEHQSEFALSGWYLTGSPPLLEQNDQEAYLWARKAASSGLAKAEYAMGYYTEVGIGANPDIEEAKRWYYRAAAQNHVQAKERLESLKRGGPKMQKTKISRSNIGKQDEGECSVM